MMIDFVISCRFCHCSATVLPYSHLQMYPVRVRVPRCRVTYSTVQVRGRYGSVVQYSYEYDVSPDVDKLPATCPQCRATLYVDAPPGLPIKAHVKLHIWQAHGGRCGGKGGQALQQHETIKGAVKWHVFCGDDPAGPIFKDDKLVDYEERHLRNDNTKPAGDVTAPDPACPLQRKLVMDAVAKSCTSRTALRNGSASSPDQIMHEGEGDKFSADSRSRQSLQTATSMRFIPLASNHLGRRGWHFEALLLELSFHIVHKPSGRRLMQGTFAMSADQAAADIRRRWGARLTWTTQRAHAMNIAYAIARMDKLLSDS